MQSTDYDETREELRKARSHLEYLEQKLGFRGLGFLATIYGVTFRLAAPILVLATLVQSAFFVGLLALIADSHSDRDFKNLGSRALELENAQAPAELRDRLIHDVSIYWPLLFAVVLGSAILLFALRNSQPRR